MVATLRAEVADLWGRLGQNSRNSSKPPSLDSPFAKPVAKSLRRRSGKKPGGQPGHPGLALALVETPDTRQRHEPGPCSGCGADLAEAPEVGMQRRGGVRPAAHDGAGHRAPADRAPLSLWGHYLR